MFRYVIIVLLLSFLVFNAAAFAGDTTEYYYALEQKGVVFGYAHVVVTATEFAGRPALQLLDSVWAQMSALGKSFEGKYRFEYRIDPASGMYFYHTSAIDQGGTTFGGIMERRGDSMYIISENLKDTSVLALPPETVCQSTRLYRHLVNFFVKDTLTRKECPVFSETSGSVNKTLYTKKGRGRLEMAGKEYDALEVESLDLVTGVPLTWWVDAATGLLLKAVTPQRDVYLADATIKEKIGRADLKSLIFSPVNKIINVPGDISFMKVQARLRPSGVWITPASLNVPGQKFVGTVEDNLVDGTFEISHGRYNGEDAPSFPCDYSGIDSLRPYLEAQEMIESHDSAISGKARELVAGAKNTWEAAMRLSRWVSAEIGYNLPGGSARQTLETRMGDCGAHAYLLAAFCRAVGIPGRVVFGCLYVPDYGGGFGQHGWNEIFVDSVGWIPVDATAKEVDYVDCGHIRLGEVKSLAAAYGPEKMEILEYRLAAETGEGAGDLASQTPYDSYVGKYQGDKGELAIVFQNGCLGLQIPGRNMIFELKDPDGAGNWVFKLTDAASISFDSDSAGSIIAMTIQERSLMPRRPGVDSAITELVVPEAYRPLLGSYNIPMQNATIDVIYAEEHLTLRLPGGNTRELVKAETANKWLASKSPNTGLELTFDADATGQVSAIKLVTLSHCNRMAETGGEVPAPGK